jgi:hypothetical protein
MGAIVYVGDDTGWIPPNGEKHEESEPCCSCGNNELLENLRGFIEGKEEKDSKCSCGGKCC